MTLIKRDAFKCNRCGHEWISKIYTHDDPPESCAKCKSIYWNRDPRKDAHSIKIVSSEVKKRNRQNKK